MKGIAKMLETDKAKAINTVKGAILKVAGQQGVTEEQLNQPCKIVADKSPLLKQEYRVAEGKTILEALTDYIVCQCGRMNLKDALLNETEKQEEKQNQEKQEAPTQVKDGNKDFQIDIVFDNNFLASLYGKNPIETEAAMMNEIKRQAAAQGVSEEKLRHKCSMKNEKTEGYRVKDFIEDGKSILEVMSEHLMSKKLRAINVVFVNGMATFSESTTTLSGNESKMDNTSAARIADPVNPENGSMMDQTQTIVDSAASGKLPLDDAIDKFIENNFETTPEIDQCLAKEGMTVEDLMAMIPPNLLPPMLEKNNPN